MCAPLPRLWLLYYYSALAVRENILQANGSDIKDWWIFHHYVSMFIAVVTLLLPRDRYASTIAPFMWFLLFQGVIMVVQNRYQGKRHYVRRSLGKAKDIDVATSETIAEKSSDLKFLVPLLVVTYVAEICLGLAACWASLDAGLRTTWPMASIGAAFVLLGLGNTWTTVSTLIDKSARAKSAQRRMSVSGSSPAAEGGNQHSQ